MIGLDRSAENQSHCSPEGPLANVNVSRPYCIRIVCKCGTTLCTRFSSLLEYSFLRLALSYLIFVATIPSTL